VEDHIRKRTLREAELMITRQLTVRQIAKEVKNGKSTVHLDLIERLPLIDRVKARKVRKVLYKHKLERASRGGRAAAARRGSK